MSDETVAESTEAVETGNETVEQVKQAAPEKKMVPLEALEAERRKRQDAEYKAQWERQQMEAALQQQKQQPEEDEDEYTQQLKKYVDNGIATATKNTIESVYVQEHPDVIERVQAELEPILQRKPWLTSVIQQAPNRWARAMEIIEDYAPKKEEPTQSKRVENANKPGHPAQMAKTRNLSKLESLNKMNRKEFSEYRASLRGRRANIR